MRRWRIEVSWECELDAEDEGQALMDADGAFNFMDQARVEELEQQPTTEEQP